MWKKYREKGSWHVSRAFLSAELSSCFLNHVYLIHRVNRYLCKALLSCPNTHIGDHTHTHDIYALAQTQGHALCNSCHITVLRFLIFVFMTFWCRSVCSLRFLYCVHCPLPAYWYCIQIRNLYPNCRTKLDGKCLSVIFFFFSPLTWGIAWSFLWSHCLNLTRRPLDMMIPSPNQFTKNGEVHSRTDHGDPEGE